MKSTSSYVWRMSACLVLLLLGCTAGVSQDRGSELGPSPQLAEVRIQQGTLVQVELAQRTNWKHLPRNSVVEGRLMLPVFAGTGCDSAGDED
jgi:hypothetical protein